MDLPSTLPFQGWNIKYNLSQSPSTPKNTPLKPIVFVHGTPWSSAVFNPIAKTIFSKPGFQVLLYDLPGYGKSQTYIPSAGEQVEKAGFEGDTSVAFQAKALTALLKQISFEQPPIVIAHDIAGSIVLRAHLLEEKLEFASMLLMDTNCVLPWGDGFYKLARSNPQVFCDLPANILEAVVRAVTRSALHNPQTGWEDVIVEPWINGPEAQKCFVRQIAQADDGDVAEMLEGNKCGEVRCPVKILWGERDQWIPREKIEDLVKRLGNKVQEMVYVPEAGHLVMLDQPARVAVEVWEWVIRS